ncbi:MAG: helix-turn-helix domain-containing protein [Acidobacteriota bacterium]
MNKNIGSDFDDFLREQGILEDVEALAVKRLLAHELRQALATERISKTELAARMGTSRSQLERLLDPENESVTLATLAKAAAALGKRLRISLEPRKAA